MNINNKLFTYDGDNGIDQIGNDLPNHYAKQLVISKGEWHST